jgi:hypothetical protein
MRHYTRRLLQLRVVQPATHEKCQCCVRDVSSGRKALNDTATNQVEVVETQNQVILPVLDVNNFFRLTTP